MELCKFLVTGSDLHSLSNIMVVIGVIASLVAGGFFSTDKNNNDASQEAEQE